MTAAEKVRENRLRRAVARQGFQLMKSRRRDPRAYDYGTYMVIDQNNAAIQAYGPNSELMTLDDVEKWVNR
jgi:hypothetical protein